MDAMPEEQWLDWKRKRLHTTIAFFILGTAEGIDNSVVLSTLYLYLRDLLKVEQPKMYYGIITACFYVFSLICAIQCGRWLDQTRRVRLYVNVTILIEIIGFLLYSIPYHPAFLIVGRCLCGVSEPFIPVITGEVIRIHGNDGSAKALMLLTCTFSFGFAVGPLLNFLFRGIHFNLYSLEVNYLNFIGIFMAGILILIMIVVNFLVHDCSKEFDLKEHSSIGRNGEAIEMSGNDEGEVIEQDFDERTCPLEVDETIPVKNILKTLCSRTDTILIFVSSFLLQYIIRSATFLLPLILEDSLRWSVTSVSIALPMRGVLSVILLVIMATYFKSDRAVYAIAIISMCSQTVMWSILIYLKYIGGIKILDISMVALFIVTNTIGWFFDDVMVRVILAKMIPSKIQSFCECLRSGIGKIAIIAASLTVPVVSLYLKWFSIPILISQLITIACFNLRRKSLMNAKELSFM